MLAAGNYKYTIDICGFGWTDRVKILMQMGRPLFLVERPYKEWFYDDMEPMIHYIPVKEDLSDLVSKYEYIESNQKLYNSIKRNMTDFALKYFSCDAYLEYTSDVIQRYGISEGGDV